MQTWSEQSAALTVSLTPAASRAPAVTRSVPLSSAWPNRKRRSPSLASPLAPAPPNICARSRLGHAGGSSYHFKKRCRTASLHASFRDRTEEGLCEGEWGMGGWVERR